MKFKGQEISQEVVEKAMQCDTPEELVALAKEHGFEITTKQAEAYLAELEDFDLDSEYTIQWKHNDFEGVEFHYCIVEI